MKIPVPLCIALIALRELVRAAAMPVHALLYLPQKRRWDRLAREVLADSSATAGPDALSRFVAVRRGRRGERPSIFVSAGEASGEAHAVRVLQAVERRGVQARWTCFGGPALQRAGAELLHPLSEHAIMGVSGVLRALPFVIRALATYLRRLRTDPPDLIVLVDYPGLHLIMGRLARRHGVPVLHYIAPQYWAWAPWRLRRYRECMDATLTILPFETRFYERCGVPAAYVGHPLLDHLHAHPPDPAEVDAVRARPTLCMLPGSRRSEIESNLPAFTALARRLRRDHPDLRFVLPHIDERRAPLIRDLLARESDDLIEFHPGPLAAWLRGARAVLAKSGTGSLEACLQGTPTVVVYRLKGWLSTWFYRTYISVPWVAAANLIAGRPVVPELVFRDDAGWTRAEAELRQLLADGPARTACLEGLREVREKLGEPGASERVAEWVVASV